MIQITDEKLRAAIQIALVGECEEPDKTEEKLMHDIKALSIGNISKSACEHNWVSSVAYKGARVCSKCNDIR